MTSIIQPIAMGRIIEQSGTTLRNALGQFETNKYMLSDVMPKFIAGFYELVDSNARSEAGGFPYKVYSHLYELGQEGQPSGRLFEITGTENTFIISLTKAKIPSISWKGNPYLWKDRPESVELGKSISIVPGGSWPLAPGPQKNPRYKDMPYYLNNIVNINYSEYPSMSALTKLAASYSTTFGVKIFQAQMPMYIKATLYKTALAARAAAR